MKSLTNLGFFSFITIKRWEDEGRWTLADVVLKDGKYYNEESKLVPKLYAQLFSFLIVFEKKKILIQILLCHFGLLFSLRRLGEDEFVDQAGVAQKDSADFKDMSKS